GAALDKTVKVWDVQTGRELLTLKGHAAPVVSVALSPGSTRLASSSSRPNEISAVRDPGEPGEVKVWDAQTGEELLTLKGHSRFVNSVTFSPGGKRLATLSRDQTEKVWLPQVLRDESPRGSPSRLQMYLQRGQESRQGYAQQAATRRNPVSPADGRSRG